MNAIIGFVNLAEKNIDMPEIDGYEAARQIRALDCPLSKK